MFWTVVLVSPHYSMEDGWPMGELKSEWCRPFFTTAAACHSLAPPWVSWVGRKDRHSWVFPELCTSTGSPQWIFPKTYLYATLETKLQMKKSVGSREHESLSRRLRTAEVVSCAWLLSLNPFLVSKMSGWTPPSQGYLSQTAPKDGAQNMAGYCLVRYQLGRLNPMPAEC